MTMNNSVETLSVKADSMNNAAKYLRTLKKAYDMLHAVKHVEKAYLTYDGVHSIDKNAFEQCAHTVNLQTGVCKPISFKMGDNPDIIDMSVFEPVCVSTAWSFIDYKIKRDFENLTVAFNLIVRDKCENISDDETNESRTAYNAVSKRYDEYLEMSNSIDKTTSINSLIKLFAYHAIGDTSNRAEMLDIIDVHHNLQKLYAINSIDGKEVETLKVVKEALNGFFYDALKGNEDVGVKINRVKADSAAVDALVKSCLRYFVEIGSNAKRGYHGEVVSENNVENRINEQVVLSLKRGIQKRMIAEETK